MDKSKQGSFFDSFVDTKNPDYYISKRRFGGIGVDDSDSDELDKISD